MEERLGIAGSGTIACGLAATAAAHGDVVMWVHSRESAQRAEARLEAAFERADDADRDRVRVVTQPHELAAAGASFVVEAIAEDRGAKTSVLAALDGVLDPGAVVVTTTSSLSVASLA